MRTGAFIQTVAAPPAAFAWAWALERSATAPLSVRAVPELPLEAGRTPGEDELVLWFGVPASSGDPKSLDCLSEDERARAARFRFEADRWAFSAAHAGLRALLGSMTGRPPGALRFAAGAYGKPVLHDEDIPPKIQFSLSHTSGCVAVAVANHAVGLDVERRSTLPDLMDVAKTSFGAEAQAALARCAGDGRTALFYRYWTLGEAFIKATGEGVAQDLTSFAFTEKGAPRLTRVRDAWGPAGRWRFHCEP